MRLVRVLVPYEEQYRFTSILDDRHIDYVLYHAEEPQNRAVVEFPLPVGAVEDVLDAARDRDIDVGEYTVVTSLETATTQNLAEVEERYVEESSEIKRISHAELRVEAQEHKPSVRTFSILAALSSMVAAAGLLLDSAIVITGAMVLAPFLSTIVSGSVGLTIDDRTLIVESLIHQPMGLGLAVVGGGIAGVAFKTLGGIPETLHLHAIGQISNFSAPNALIVTIAVIAGVAVALTVAADIASAFAGIAVAAAIVPSAATIGLGAVWGSASVALGAGVLLAVNIATINLVSYLTFVALGYRPNVLEYIQPGLTVSLRTTGTLVVLLVALLVIGLTTVAAAQYIAFERTANSEVDAVISQPAYEDLRLVRVRVENHLRLFDETPTVTVVVAADAHERYPSLAGRLRRAIGSRSGRPVRVRVRVLDYRIAPPNGTARISVQLR